MSKSDFDFDKHFNRMAKFSTSVIIAGIIANLILIGAVVYGIVKLVQHFF